MQNDRADRELVQVAMTCLGRNRPLLAVPFAFWHGLAAALSLLPEPPLTRDQVVLMQADNVVGQGAGAFSSLGIQPRTFAQLARRCLRPEGR